MVQYLFSFLDDCSSRLAAFPASTLVSLFSVLPATSKGTITDVNHTTCSYAPNPPWLFMEFRQKSELTGALVPIWCGPCHLPYLFFLPLPSLSESNGSGLISISWIRPGRLCLRVPGLLSLASHLLCFLSPFSSHGLTQAFPDYVCEVTSILSTSIFFISFKTLLSKQPFAFIYLLIYICLCAPSRVKSLLLCYMSPPFPQCLACSVCEYVLDKWESEHVIQWDMSNEGIRTCHPLPTLVTSPIKHFVLTPFPLLFYVPSSQLLPGITSQIDHLCLEGKMCVCLSVCVCGVSYFLISRSSPTGEEDWHGNRQCQVTVYSEVWEKQIPPALHRLADPLGGWGL